MDWKRSLPADLFYVSQNGLVIPRYISKPVFSFTLLSSILLLLVVLIVVTPSINRSQRIFIPESYHSQFQFVNDGTKGNFLVIVYIARSSEIWISDERIENPDSPTLADELSRQFLNKKNWIKNLKVSFSTKKYFQYAGFIGNSEKLFLYIDLNAKWGKVVDLLRAAQAAGVRDACFLTEEAYDPRWNGAL
jgi:biopolymer transport protein ExbD